MEDMDPSVLAVGKFSQNQLKRIARCWAKVAYESLAARMKGALGAILEKTQDMIAATN